MRTSGRTVHRGRLPLAAGVGGPATIDPPRCSSTLLSLAAGVLLALAFQPYGLWFTAPGGVGLLCWLSRQGRLRHAVGSGFLAGLVQYAMTVSFEYVVGWWLPLLLVPVLALWVGLVAAVQHLVQRLRLWPLWAAAAWTAAEAGAQRFPLGGFAWDRLGFTAADAPFGGFLWVLGAAGTGFVVALTGTVLLAACDLLRAGRPRRARALVPTALALLLLVGGGALRAVPVRGPDEGEVTIAVVQGGVDGSAGPRTTGYARSVTDNHVSETIMAMARARTGLDPMPDLVLWPENSTDMDPNNDQRTRELIDRARAIAGRPILVGAVTDGPGAGERQTTALWWTAVGETSRYAKRNAVPFGEYTPMKRLVLALVPMARQVGRQTVPGTGPGVVEGDLGDGRRLAVGDIICYELAFDSTVYDTERAGGRVVTVQSNNATYSGTMQPYQQFSITRVRAMEMRREIVVSTTSSYSGLIGADGSVLARSAPDTAYARSFTVPLRSGLTPAMTVGPLSEGVCAALAALGALAGVLVGGPTRRGRGRYTEPVAAAPPQQRSLAAREGPHQHEECVMADRKREPLDKVLVIIPTYNEVENLESVVGRLREAVPAADALIADDNSPDGTGAIADRLAAEDDHIHVLHRAGKEGLAAAYVAGFRWGLENGYDVLVEMDADGSHRPTFLPAMLAALENADMVKGSRWMRGGEGVDYDLAREWLSRLANIWIQAVMDLPVHDSTGGFNAFRASALEAMDLDTIASKGYTFQVDLTRRVIENGGTVAEVPISFPDRQLGESKMSGSIITEALRRTAGWGYEKRSAQLRQLAGRASTRIKPLLGSLKDQVDRAR